MSSRLRRPTRETVALTSSTSPARTGAVNWMSEDEEETLITVGQDHQVGGHIAEETQVVGTVHQVARVVSVRVGDIPTMGHRAPQSRILAHVVPFRLLFDDCLRARPLLCAASRCTR